MSLNYSHSNCDDDQEKRLLLELFLNKKENVIPPNKINEVLVFLKKLENAFDHFNGTNLNLDPILMHFKTRVKYKLLKLQTSMEQSQLNNNSWLIFPNKCTLNDHVEYLESIKNLSQKNEKYQTAVSLESALQQALPNDVIFISQGDHFLNSSEILKVGVCLKSASNDPYNTTIDANKENALIEFMGDSLMIENVHLNVSRARCAVITHCGQITLKNCIISGHETAEHAIIAIPGAKVVLENCKISGFNVGLYVSSNSTVNMINCKISDVSIAIKLFDESKVCLSVCVFEKISCNCFYFETKNVTCQTGDETLLEGNPCITITDCKFENNPTIVVIGYVEDILNTDN